MTRSKSSREAWRIIGESLKSQTPEKAICLILDLIKAQMPEDESPISLYARLTSVTFHVPENIEDPALVQYMYPWQPP